MARGDRGKDSLKRSKGAGRRRREVYVFTEGKETEPSYFDIITDEENCVRKDPGLQVVLHIQERNRKSHRKPLDLVEKAARLKREVTREAKRAKLKSAMMPQVWCVFDHDKYPYLAEAMKQAKEAGVEVAFSHPCFEVWRLAHYRPVSGMFSGVCGEAAKRLPFAPGSRDAENPKVVLPHQVLKRFQKAKDNAEQMNAQHGPHVARIDRDPYTDMHVFVEEALGISSY
ncbi:RloB family protein [Streptomyces sp. NPDC017988]|uniref:RloB family protein n=1 Tax=Streptomyces sp. NPDC017988 TaxID=3365025 RepID=UPI0037AF6CFA